MASLAMMRPYIDTYPGDFFGKRPIVLISLRISTPLKVTIRIYQACRLAFPFKDSYALPSVRHI